MLSVKASLYLDPRLSCAELGTAQPQLVSLFSKIQYFHEEGPHETTVPAVLGLEGNRTGSAATLGIAIELSKLLQIYKLE